MPPLSGVSTIPVNANVILRKAFDDNLSEVVIVGFDSHGNEYFASSNPDAGDVLFHFERAKHRLMRLIDAQTESFPTS